MFSVLIGQQDSDPVYTMPAAYRHDLTPACYLLFLACHTDMGSFRYMDDIGPYRHGGDMV